jgi:hypothetical protein
LLGDGERDRVEVASEVVTVRAVREVLDEVLAVDDGVDLALKATGVAKNLRGDITGAACRDPW